MKCQEFEIKVVDILHTVVADTAALAHAERCERCGARLAEERALSADLRALADADRDLAPPPRLEADLRAALRKIVEPAPVARRTATWWPAAAAVATLLGGAIAYQVLVAPAPTVPPIATAPSTPTTSPVPERNESTTPVRQPSTGLVTTAYAGPSHSIRRSRLMPPPALPDQPTEIATEYFPLVGSDTIAPVDGGMVVRIELPRAALSSLGMQMNLARSNEKITADVMLGHDGVARAIRFVQSSAPTERRNR